MDWSNERYVRLYVRDTKTWKKARWEGQCLFMMLLRIVDRAGILEDIDDPIEDLSLMTGLPEEHVKPGYERLMKSGAIELRGNCLIIPNFIEAQEASKSDAQRQRESREGRRARALSVTKRDSGKTKCDKKSQPVTTGHNRSHDVTLCCADPVLDHNSADPMQKITAPPRRARSNGKGKGTPVWLAYSLAYMQKYGTEPVRNAKTNALCAQLVDRLGEQEAPLVAAYYLNSRNNYHVGRGHSLQALVGDCEKIRTEWATGESFDSTSTSESKSEAHRRRNFEILAAIDAKGQANGHK